MGSESLRGRRDLAQNALRVWLRRFSRSGGGSRAFVELSGGIRIDTKSSREWTPKTIFQSGVGTKPRRGRQ